MARDQILELLDDPKGLESLYRRDVDAFRAGLDAAALKRPESMVLRVWQARLNYGRQELGAAWRSKLGYALTIVLVFGAVLRIPAIWLEPERFYPRVLPSIVLLAVTAYFLIDRFDRRRLAFVLALAGVALIWVGVLPDVTVEGQISFGDSVTMALLHLPILFWILLGLVFTAADWRQTAARIAYVRYNGELVVLGSVVALGGLVFTFITLALFQFVSDNIEEWYFQNIAVFGAVGVPVVGTFLYDTVFNQRTAIASVLARVFAPLFLVMAVIYLVVAFLGGENPFLDRDFLIMFNALLLVVLVITVFSIVERTENTPVGVVDYINVALVVVTLIIDAIALSAIVFRLASFGYTPNRVVVLGMNLVVLVHLAWMSWGYVALIRGRAGSDQMRGTVATYLPVYGVWATIVAFVLPVVFGFA